MLHVGIRVCRHNPSDLTLSPLADPCWGYWPAGGEGGGGYYIPLQLAVTFYTHTLPSASALSLSYILIHLSILPPHISLFLYPTSSYISLSQSYLLILIHLSFLPPHISFSIVPATLAEPDLLWILQ